MRVKARARARARVRVRVRVEAIFRSLTHLNVEVAHTVLFATQKLRLEETFKISERRIAQKWIV